MGKWENYLDTLSSVIKVIFFTCVLVVVGQLLTNDAYHSLYRIQDDTVILVGEACLRIAQFVLWYCPILFIMRLVVSKNRAYDNIMLSLIAYITFTVFSIYFGSGRMEHGAYRSILGITVSDSALPLMANQVNEPIFMGLIGALVVVCVVRFVSSRVKNMRSIGLFGNVDIELRTYLYVFVLSALASLGVSVVWPYIYSSLMGIMNFIASDLNNPINLYLYGVMDQLTTMFGLTNMFRSPFWYGTMGGSISTIAGQAINGDVAMFSYAVAENTILNGIGRLITPYYILNIFILPASFVAFYRVNSDTLDKKRNLFILFGSIVLSLFGGIWFPFLFVLVFLAPPLFIFHTLFFGALFGLLNSFNITLGFVESATTITALPGSIVEFIIYLSNHHYRITCVIIAAIGLMCALLYYAVFTFYFKKGSVDSAGANYKALGKGIVSAFGGVGNLKHVNASLAHVTVQVFDPNEIDLYQLKRLGATRVIEKRSGYSIFFGGKSFLIKRLIDALINASIRDVE